MVESLAQQAGTQNLNLIFGALADGTRRAILRDLSGGGKSVGEIARPFTLTLAAVSKHIKVLEGAGLVTREKQGSFQMVTLRPETLQTAEEWIAYYERHWTLRLEALDKALQDEQHEGERR